MAVRELSDAELIAGARKGDSDAYGELYRRHVDSARAAARALARSNSDADDLTSEAFARVLRALQGGGGPEVSFRPYLVTAVRNVFYDKVRRNREDPSPDMSDEVNVALLDAANSQEDGAFASAAFATLPERWQLVLWHTEVEGRSVAEVAPILGLAPNAVAALAYRAREGLRQAYLQAHLRVQVAAECRECSASLGSYVRDGLSARDRRRVDAHLDGCATCTALVAELTDTNNTLRAALIPALIGVSSAAYLSGLSGQGFLAMLTRAPKKQQALAAGVVAACVIAVAAFAGIFSGDDESPALSSPTSSTAQFVSATDDSTSATAPVHAVDPVPSTPPVNSVPPTVTAAATTTAVPTSTRPPAQPTVPPTTVRRPINPVATNPITTNPVTTTPVTTNPVTTNPVTTNPVTTNPVTTTPVTTTPATTPPTSPPQAFLTISSLQRSPALSSGQFRVQVTVTNTGSSVANGVRLDVPTPGGAALIHAEAVRAPSATFVSAFAPGWSCSGNVSCTFPALAPGQASVLQLTFAVSATAPSNMTFVPSISAPAGSIVISPPLAVPVATVADLLIAETERGAIRAIGNSVVTCDDLSANCVDARAGTATGTALDHNSHAMQYVNTAGGTFNSSSAQLSLSGAAGRAYLVWSGDLDQSGPAPNPAEFNKVTFTTPSGTTTVTAVDSQNFDPWNLGTYTAYADVTSLMAGSGTYSVGDVQTSIGTASFGGWSLVVIDRDDSLPERFIMVAAPLVVVATYPVSSFTMTVDLPQAMANGSGAIVAAAFEGDRSLTGESVSLSGFVVSNAFQGKIGGVRDPAHQNALGTDVLVATTSAMNGSQLDFTASTTDDRYILSLVGISLDV
ncbi:MAG TPA: sigma-70 family RNA polymerase sigma factor [Ilumatobacteraceae bacterium]|nr:sigma-70 family RNA polymerase sigma factor [Ilumatobacteraceae bacterium]